MENCDAPSRFIIFSLYKPLLQLFILYLFRLVNFKILNLDPFLVIISFHIGMRNWYLGSDHSVSLHYHYL